jgi:hypothetical protein
MVGVIPAVLEDEGPAALREEAGEPLPGAGRDHRQGDGCGVVGGEGEKAREGRRRQDGVVVPPPEGGLAAGGLPGVELGPESGPA